jgi:hypothetical protein
MFTRAWLISLSDLEPVTEDAADDEADNAAIQAQLQEEIAPPHDDDVAEEDDRRESRHSVISGTTAKTSFSQEEIAELDADVMVDNLPSLAASAEQLAKLLLPPDHHARLVMWKEIRVANSKHNKLYRSRINAINAYKPSFGSQPYILPAIVLRALLGVDHIEDVPPGPWRPDDLLYGVNLATMLRNILVDIPDPGRIGNEAYQNFQHLGAYFAPAIAGPDFDPEALKTSLAIQTQLAIMRLESNIPEPEYDPQAIITEALLTSNEQGDLVYRYADALGLADMPEGDDSVKQRVDKMYEPYGENYDDPMTALAFLKMAFPWDAFVDQIVQYFEGRRAQLEQQINAAGGADAIVAGLSAEVQRRESARTADMKRESFTATGTTTTRKGFSAAALKQWQNRRRSQAAAAPSSTAPVAQMTDPQLAPQQQPVASAPVDNDWAPAPQDDHEGPPAIEETTQERARLALKNLTSFQEQQMKWTNGAKGKQRMASSSTVPGQEFQLPGRASARGPYPLDQPQSSGVKRTHAEMDDGPAEFDPTQDEGFQTDTRDTTRADARRRALAAYPTGRRPAPRSSIVDYETPGSATSSPARSGRAPKRQRKNPGSAYPEIPRPDGPDAPPLDANRPDYEHAKIMAKLSRVEASQRKPPQARRPWQPEEENALIQLIQNHAGEGVSYSALKRQDDREGGVLRHRTAEDMRFKARNMKLTFLL